MARVYTFLITSFVLFSYISCSTSFDELKLKNFKLKIEGGRIGVVPDNVSVGGLQGPTGFDAVKPHFPIELGVQLSNHGIDPNSAEITDSKIIFDGLTFALKNSEEEQCIRIESFSTRNVTLEDCFRLSPYNWYAGPEQWNQYWPIEQATINEYSYVTKESADLETAGAIAEPYWLNSNGLLIYVDPSVPLFVDQNHHRKNSLCLLAKHAAPYLRSELGPTLKYTVCKFENPRVAHEYAVKAFLGKPSGVPDVRMVQHPIWSSWAKYKTEINDDVILGYAKAINEHGFNNSQLEIDDLWETCYGSVTFDKARFPNTKKLTGELNRMGFRTTLWVHPFINLNCGAHKEAASKGYFVKNTKGDIKMEWWNGPASYIDFTNPAAADWHEARLRNMLTESGIDSLKFDGGENNWAPQVPVLNGPESEHPWILCRKYVEMAAKFGSMIEVRTGKRTQNLPVFVRMIDRDSRWGYMHRGIHSVITTTFQMNLNGYPFVLPDMVGGNAQYGDHAEKELFIRYLQLNVFLPAIQFSIPPWDFDAETVALSKRYVDLHYQYSGKIVELMHKAVETGHPINPPIWWIDPTDKEAHGINSEYLLGEDILVAPVLEKGATVRDIYLPKGYWRDEAMKDKPMYKGPVWLKDYPAPLDTLPYFTRISSSANHASFAVLLSVLIALLTVLR